MLRVKGLPCVYIQKVYYYEVHREKTLSSELNLLLSRWSFLQRPLQKVSFCTGVKRSLVLEPWTSKIEIRTSIYFHPVSDEQVKKYSARLYFLECPVLFGNWTSKIIGVIVQRILRFFTPAE